MRARALTSGARNRDALIGAVRAVEARMKRTRGDYARQLRACRVEILRQAWRVGDPPAVTSMARLCAGTRVGAKHRRSNGHVSSATCEEWLRALAAPACEGGMPLHARAQLKRLLNATRKTSERGQSTLVE